MPTNVPIVTHSTGDVLSASNWNNLTVLNTGMAMFGNGIAVLGSPPALNAPNFLFQAGTAQMIIDSGGVGRVGMNKSFPGGILAFGGTPNSPFGLAVACNSAALALNTLTFTTWDLAGNLLTSNNGVSMCYWAIGF